MKTTITDVAQKVGVSIATVSRVINNSPYVSNKTRQNILRTMEEMNYKPYYRLTMKSIRVVGVLVPDINNMFYPPVLKTMEKEFIKNHYNIFLCHTSESLEDERTYLDTLLSKNVDGLIIFSARPMDFNNTHIKEISKKIPVLIINDYMLGSNVYSVMSDMIEGSYQATNYLGDLGHKKIAFLDGKLEYSMNRDKLMGYKNALAEKGIEVRDDYIIFDTPYEDGGYRGVKKLLGLKDRPTAILCASDQLAIGVMSALYEQGYSIPEDFSLIGYGNIPISAKIYPPLTTVNQFPEKIGRISSRTIMRAIAKEEIEQRKILLHPQMCIRNSCKALD